MLKDCLSNLKVVDCLSNSKAVDRLSNLKAGLFLVRKGNEIYNACPMMENHKH